MKYNRNSSNSYDLQKEADYYTKLEAELLKKEKFDVQSYIKRKIQRKKNRSKHSS